MANKLSARFLDTTKEPGRYSDGGGSGLMLVVSKTGAKKWIQRVAIQGKRRDIGLGKAGSEAPAISLREAREIAAENKKIADAGLDPIAKRDDALAEVMTFENAARKAHAEHSRNLKNPKDRKAFIETLETYVFPRVGKTPIEALDQRAFRQILVAIQNDPVPGHPKGRPELARKLRQRISRVYKWARGNGYAEVNPVDADALNMPRPLAPRQSFKSLHYNDVSEALTKIRQTGAWHTVKLCLEFIVLTAVRSGEARGARWAEIDMAHENGPVWIIPAQRMKAGREHRVPLSRRAVATLERAKEYKDESGLVFPSIRGKQISDNTLSKLLRENEIGSTPHGFRSSFRTWVSEVLTSTPHEVGELCLAHETRSATALAYDRTDKLAQRVPIMQAWADFLISNETKVIRPAFNGGAA